MDAKYQKLYTELRNTRQELMNKLNSQGNNLPFKKIIKEELADIDTAITKMMNNQYGICEISGELLPIELLEIMPTIKSIDDFEEIGNFFRKSFY